MERKTKKINALLHFGVRWHVPPSEINALLHFAEPDQVYPGMSCYAAKKRIPRQPENAFFYAAAPLQQLRQLPLRGAVPGQEPDVGEHPRWQVHLRQPGQKIRHAEHRRGVAD